MWASIDLFLLNLPLPITLFPHTMKKGFLRVLEQDVTPPGFQGVNIFTKALLPEKFTLLEFSTGCCGMSQTIVHGGLGEDGLSLHK